MIAKSRSEYVILLHGTQEADTIMRTQELPFQRIEHQVATVDAQPSNETGGILVVVSGALLVSLRQLDERNM